MPKLKLNKIVTNSCQGIDAENSVVVVFPEYGKNIVVASGDMGKGKTSWLHSVLYGMGEEFGFKLENLINLKDGVLKGSNEFESDGKKYRVTYTMTKSSNKFLLERLFRDADEPTAPGKWIKEGDPKTLMKKLVGHVATSPMFLKEEKGEKQIKWLYSALSVPQEVREKEEDIKSKLDQYTKSRTAAGNLYKEIHSALSQSEMYNLWEASEQAYAEDKSIESVKTKLDEADRERNRYNLAQNKVAKIQQDILNVDNNISLAQKQIDDLLVKIQMLQNERITHEQELEKGNAFIEARGNVNENYNNALVEFTEINTYILNKNNWLSIKQKKEEMDKAQDLMIHLDAKKDEARSQLKDLITYILPDIPGLEVETASTLTVDRNEGIYIYGKTPAQLSESELFDFYFKVCISQGINMVFIENLSSFGTKTIETLNELADKGVYVFATMMDRRLQSLKIEMVEKIQ